MIPTTNTTVSGFSLFKGHNNVQSSTRVITFLIISIMTITWAAISWHTKTLQPWPVDTMTMAAILGIPSVKEFVEKSDGWKSGKKNQSDDQSPVSSESK